MLAIASQLVGVSSFAQETEEEGKEVKKEAKATRLEEITVRGSRLVAQQFVGLKRESRDIIDSLGEDEIASLPALNAVEVIKLLPGITTFSDGFGSEANERGGVSFPTTIEARFASIRGIRGDLNLVTIDGLNLAVPNSGGRSNFLDWFPVNLSKRVEIIKTFNSEQDSNAIGGILNVVTRSGFDYDETLLNITSQLSQNELNKSATDYDTPFNLGVTYADQLSDSWAIAASINWNRTDFITPVRNNEARVYFDENGDRTGVFGEFNHSEGAQPGNGIDVPLTNRFISRASESDRYGGGVRIDFRPTEETDIWAVATANLLDQKIFRVENDVRLGFICGGFFNGCVNRAVEQQGGNTGTGTILFQNSDESLFSEAQDATEDSSLFALQLGVNHRFNGSWALEAKGSFSKAEQDTAGFISRYAVPGTEVDLTLTYDLSDRLRPQFFVDEPSRVFDPARYDLTTVNQEFSALNEDVIDIDASVAFNLEENDLGWGGKAGVRYKNTDRNFKDGNTLYTSVDSVAAGFSLDNVLHPVSGSGANVDLDNLTNYQSLFQDVDQVRSQVLSRLDETGVFTSTSLSLDDDFDIEEETLAAYAYAEYRADNYFLNVGLRYERTESASNGFGNPGAAVTPDDIDEIPGLVLDPVDPDVVRLRSSGSASRDFLLPSATFNYDFREDLRLRLAYSESLGRPAFNSLAAQGDMISFEPGNSQQILTITIANPDIRPRRSDNYDASLEWYLDDGAGLLSVGYFKKEINDDIYVSTSPERIQFMLDVGNGPETFEANVTTVSNDAETDMEGVEVNLVKSFAFIPHPFFEKVGTNINVTLIDGEFRTADGERLPAFVEPGQERHANFALGQPERLANLSLYYTDERLDINVGANYTDEFVTFFNTGNFGQTVYVLAETQINAKVSYQINDKFQIVGTANNLARAGKTRVSAEVDADSVRRRFIGGRSFSLGLNYSL